MMKFIIPILLFCISSIFFSCKKNEIVTESKLEQNIFYNTLISSNIKTIDSIVLYDGAPFYEENSNGKMIYVDKALLGETIKIYTINDITEQKEAIRLLSSGEEETFNFVHINYYGNDYWIRDVFITNNVNIKPGILITDSFTYSNADGTSATSKKLNEGTIVAIDPSTKQSDTDLNIDFISVTYYSGTPFGKSVFVKIKNLSDYPGDIIANQILSRLITETSIKPEVEDILFEKMKTGLPLSEYMIERLYSTEIEILERRK